MWVMEYLLMLRACVIAFGLSVNELALVIYYK